MVAAPSVIRERPSLLDVRAEKAERHLFDFIKLMWSIVEPSRPFISGWHVEAICEHLEAVTDGQIKRLLLNVPPGAMKSLSVGVFWPAWEWGPCKLPHLRHIGASYAIGLTLRDNLRCRRVLESPLYRRLWGDRFFLVSDQNAKGKFENDKTGWKLATSVSGLGTGERGDRFNIDDPHKVNEAESDKKREGAIDWFNEVVPTRMNDPDLSAIVVVMQRVHERDVSGEIIERELGYENVCIPMEWDSRRNIPATSIGWVDPRIEDGELMDPQRFPRHVVADLKKTLGPYACNPYEAPVLMADLSMKPIGEIRAGDEVIGFGIGDTPLHVDGAGHRRQHLRKTRVRNVFSGVKPVVKITLDSGRVIRCTPDHRWFSRCRSDRKCPGPVYLPATVGRRLVRICDPELPQLGADDLRTAGWLSGFFDGEGSVSVCRKKGTPHRASSSIVFYQGAGRNLPLCELLESALGRFGFEFSVHEDMRKDSNTRANYAYRQYRLTGNGLPMYQRFLHVVQPHKWRDRIIAGALGTKFIKARERVISIEPDGEEMTYALETETGNYVVWGLASSNSAGQLQQLPAPRGGGIIKEDWWQLWGNPLDPDDEKYKKFPHFDFVLVSADTASGEKEENDWWAVTVWGSWVDRSRSRLGAEPSGSRWGNLPSQEGEPKLMLIYAWRAHCEIHEFVQRLGDTCEKYHADRLIVEEKASGKSVVQEIRRLFRGVGWSTIGINPNADGGGDKVARAHSVVNMFEDKVVYAPDKTWAQMVIDEVKVFPRGKNDDLLDTVVQALRYLRKIGIARLSGEQSRKVEHSKQYRRNPPPLYTGR